MTAFDKYYFYATVFIVGAVILVIEILGTRILATFYGSTIYVWSSLITATLAALSLGYWLGGKVADKKPNMDTLYSLLFLAGALILTTPFYSNWTLLVTDPLGLRFGPLAASALIFIPSLFFLGIASPFAVKLTTSDLDKLGVRAGNIYALSTFGSITGALLAGFYLFVNFTISAILNTLGLILVIIFIIWKVIQFSQK